MRGKEMKKKENIEKIVFSFLVFGRRENKEKMREKEMRVV